jgi:hypothetical protein
MTKPQQKGKIAQICQIEVSLQVTPFDLNRKRTHSLVLIYQIIYLSEDCHLQAPFGPNQFLTLPEQGAAEGNANDED